MGSLLVGCSASSGGIASMSEADQTIASTENETEATGDENIETSAEFEETIVTTEENSTLTGLKVWSLLSNYHGIQEGKMKKAETPRKIIGILLLASGLVGCSGRISDDMGMTGNEHVMDAVGSTSVADETIEDNRDLTENIDAETEVKSSDKEPTVLKIYSMVTGGNGYQEGWMRKILLDELNIELYYVNNGTDIKTNCEQADIIIWMSEGIYLMYKDCGLILEWDENFFNKYGVYLKEHIKGQIDYVTDLSDGIAYGFVDNGRGEEEWSMSTIWTLGAQSEHIEEAMNFISWLAAPEGYLTYLYGPEKLCWDMDKEGYYYLTDFGVQCRKEAQVQMPQEYGGLSFSSGCLWTGPILNWDTVNEVSAHKETYNWTTWHLMQDD